MKITKSFLLIAISAIITVKCWAQVPTDTSKTPLIASNLKATKVKVVLRAANVSFPSVFEQHKEESKEYISAYAKNKREHLNTIYRRSSKYFPKVRSIFKKYNVPGEFAVLMALESGFNGKVVSRAGAVGYWQFMDGTAKEYGLKIIENQECSNCASKKAEAVKVGPPADKSVLPATPAPIKQVDDRHNFTKSTYAAAKYFRDMYRSLNDWLLVAAAYNCGMGRVKNAMAASGKAKPTFWDVKKYLPGETRAYVMNLLAVSVIFKNYKSFSANDMVFDDIMGEQTLMLPEEQIN